MTTGDERWHVNKGVPLALLVFLAAQTGTFIWYASAMNSAIGSNTTAIEKNAVRVEQNSESRVEIGGLKAELRSINATLLNIQADIRSERAFRRGRAETENDSP